MKCRAVLKGDVSCWIQDMTERRGQESQQYDRPLPCLLPLLAPKPIGLIILFFAPLLFFSTFPSSICLSPLFLAFLSISFFYPDLPSSPSFPTNKGPVRAFVAHRFRRRECGEPAQLGKISDWIAVDTNNWISKIMSLHATTNQHQSQA